MTEEKKSMVPKLRFPGFNETWEQRKLEDICDVRDGTHSSPKYFDNGFPLVTSKNLRDGVIDLSDVQLISKEDYLEINKRSKVDLNDILMSMIGTIGNLALIKEEPTFAIKNVALIKSTDKVKMDYLFSYLSSPSSKCDIDKSVEGGTQKFLSLTKVRGLKILLPGIEEQQKIGSFSVLLDGVITLHQRKLEGLSKLKKSLLQKMFPKNGQQNPEVRFPGFTEAWEQRKFQGITQRVSTSSISSIDFPSVEYEDIEAGSGILNKDVKLKEKNKKGIVFDKNDILFGKLRPYLMNWLLADFKGVAVGDFWVLRSQNFDPKFVCSLIQSKSFQEVANRSSGSKMPRADWNLVSNTLFFVPPQNNEQRKIGELFSSLDKVITLHQRKLESLKKLKKSLLQQMFV